jgi:hypothetical protein
VSAYSSALVEIWVVAVAVASSDDAGFIVGAGAGVLAAVAALGASSEAYPFGNDCACATAGAAANARTSMRENQDGGVDIALMMKPSSRHC